MTPGALLLGCALGCGLWMLVSLLIPQPAPSMSQRIAPYLLDVCAEARDLHYGPKRNLLVIAGIVLSPALLTLATKVDALLGGRDSQRIVFGRSGRQEEFEDYRLRRAVFVGTASVAGAPLGSALSPGVFDSSGCKPARWQCGGRTRGPWCHRWRSIAPSGETF